MKDLSATVPRCFFWHSFYLAYGMYDAWKEHALVIWLQTTRAHLLSDVQVSILFLFIAPCLLFSQHFRGPCVIPVLLSPVHLSFISHSISSTSTHDCLSVIGLWCFCFLHTMSLHLTYLSGLYHSLRHLIWVSSRCVLFSFSPVFQIS